ncbi:Uncharacterised protein [Buttiauxella agrestis]|uniref:Response regulatory domain-containing protein n=1 Tax=Buttiauxella agrestis TaxID=82977 RepID=A0A381KNS3_9ENTR|nr:Uncharacterised protein [Buttiauxella agrestis]
MKVVLIKDSNSSFKECVKLIINNYFYSTNDRRLITFTENFNEESVKHADVIILNIPAGTYYLCFPLLKLRKKDSILIIVIDEIVEHKLKELLHCFEKKLLSFLVIVVLIN